MTVAKLLGLRPKIDKNTGKEIFRKDPNANAPDLDDFDLIIIDEGSMISSELLELLQQEFTLFGPKFLFIGDPAQLPPVGEKNSLVFQQVPNQVHLDEVVRYAGSILSWATALRNQTSVAPVDDYADNQTLIIKDDKEFVESVITEFASNQFQSDSDYCRVLAWTNASVNRWNKRIRKAIFGKNAPRFVKGEKLVATEACIRETITPIPSGKTIKDQEIILPSSGEVEVLEAFAEKKPVEYGNFHAEIFSYWAIKAQDEYGIIKNFRVLAESEEARLQSILDHYAKRKEWEDFWALKRAFDSLAYAYALTVHRSQGSTFQKVFLDLRNLLTNRKANERNKLLYTAATRASQQMIVLTD